MDLDLCEPAKSTALDLWHAFPAVVFTSGRRSLVEQAAAMASNVVLNPKWIEQTYLPSQVSKACQAWVDDCTHPLDKLGVASGLVNVLRSFGDIELSHLSKHLSGLAFDVKPVPAPRGMPIKIWLYERAEHQGGKFLEREGGLTRWHFEV